MKKILLIGNPNTGKSVVFSRLTGASVMASNYPGTTVNFTEGTTKINGEKVRIIDIPGIYSLEPESPAEKAATKMMDEADLIINVVDSTNLERNLNLTMQLLQRDIPMVIALNMWDETKHQGIEIDREKLEKLTQVPVVPTVGLTGEGFKELISRLPEAETPDWGSFDEDQKWAKIGQIIKACEKITRKGHTIKEKIAELTVKPLTGLPIAGLVLAAIFWFVVTVGEFITEDIIEPIFYNFYEPLIMQLSSLLGEKSFFHIILIGEIYEEGLNFEEAMGVLTTGLFVPFAMVLPFIITFYFILALLEDSGYLPRLGTLADNFFHRLGMHGYGILPVMLGMGCHVPGMMSTRVFETRKQRFISATLMAIVIPCSAQTAMIFGVLGARGIQPLILIFSVLFAIYIIAGLLLNQLVKGESPEIFMEIPPYRLPVPRAIFKKTGLRIKHYLTEGLPWLLAGVFIANILHGLGLLEYLSAGARPLMSFWFGLPGIVAPAMVIGFLRKDLAVGMLLPLGLSTNQLIIAIVILVIYFPCIAAFAVMLKELGFRDMLKSALTMLVTTLAVGGLLRLVLLGL
ncbi:MAG: FeoB small GTPase domain-containing protein [bacterium]